MSQELLGEVSKQKKTINKKKKKIEQEKEEIEGSL